MSLIQTGRPSLFADVDPLTTTFSPMDKILGGAARGLFGMTAGQIRQIWTPGVFSPRVNSQLETQYGPVARAMEQFPGLSIRTLADLFQQVTGRVFEIGGRGRVPEAMLTGTYPKTLATVVNLAMLPIYRHRLEQYGIPRALARFGRTSNSRPQQSVTVGTFAGGLPSVLENGTYVELPLLQEQGTTFAMVKKGGIVLWSIEFQKNDRVDVLTELGRALGEAGADAVASACWSLWTSNSSAGPDASPWHSAGHGNLGAGPLAAPALVDALTKLAGQIPLGGSLVWPSPIVRGSVYLIVHPSLFDLALSLNQLEGRSHRWLFGEANEYIIQNPLTAAPQWGVTRAASEVPSVLVNFMDGEEYPAFDLSDAPTAGTVLTQDAIQFKAKLWFGAGLVEWRGSVWSPGT
jgi:hypothetical protein